MMLHVPHIASFLPRNAQGTYATELDAQSRVKWETSAKSLSRQHILAEITKTHILLSNMC